MLHLAAHYNRDECMVWLIKRGANETCRNKENRDVLDEIEKNSVTKREAKAKTKDLFQKALVKNIYILFLCPVPLLIVCLFKT